MRTSRTTAAAVALCGSVLVACGGDDGAGPNAEAGHEYVALGDSYASAPGLGPETGPAGCLQTARNFPHLLAEQADLELTDVSCGGAQTRNLARPQQLPGGGSAPPQLDAVTADTDLVTVTIGGNDGRAFAALVTTCVGLGRQQPQGAPCTEIAADNPDYYDELFDGISTTLADALDTIATRAPGAHVIVVGYPQIVPGRGTCQALPLAAGDYPFARQVVDDLAAAQERAAESAGVEFVDLRAESAGHDICSDDPWVAGVTVESGRRGAPYHPYAEQQQAVADLLAERIAGQLD